MQEALIAIARYIGLHPWAGKSGGGPVIPGMPDLFTRGTGKRKMRTDVEIGGALYDGLTMVLDFTVVSCMKSGLAEYNEARAGSEDPDRFVRAADLRKATKYAAVCRAAGYAFIPFALSSGGRPSPGALRALRKIYAAAKGNVDNWFYCGTLVPRIFAQLGIGQYEHALGVRRGIYATLHEASGPPPHAAAAPPPSPEMADVRWSFGEFPDCDPRWSWSRDGASAFELERGQSYASFLRETYPAFFV